jgi:hypothetical protein
MIKANRSSLTAITDFRLQTHNKPRQTNDMKSTARILAPLLLSAAFANAAVYNFDLARNRGGVVFNASTDDSNLVFNTASPAGTSSMTWNVFNTDTNNLTNATVSLSNLVSSTNLASSLGVSIGLVSTDGYSDETFRDGVWTSYMRTNVLNGAGPTVTLSGFSLGETVNLVLYTGHARWSGNNTGEFTFGGVTKTYAEATQSSTMPLTEGVTYLRFDNLVPDSNGNIIGTFGALAGQTAVLAGLQFEVIPEPSSALLAALGLIALLRRRRP